MAKENWLKEIRDGIRNLETETARESFLKQDLID